MRELHSSSSLRRRKETLRQVWRTSCSFLRCPVRDEGQVVYVYRILENGLDSVKVRRSREAGFRSAVEETII